VRVLTVPHIACETNAAKESSTKPNSDDGRRGGKAYIPQKKLSMKEPRKGLKRGTQAFISGRGGNKGAGGFVVKLYGVAESFALQWVCS